MYGHRKFARHVEGWVGSVDSPLLNRAWEVVKECINAHAIVDREENQSCKLARALAWEDWGEACVGKDTTATYAGLVEEMFTACPPGREDELERVLTQAHELGLGHVSRAEAVVIQAKQEFPGLKLIWNRDWEDIEN